MKMVHIFTLLSKGGGERVTVKLAETMGAALDASPPSVGLKARADLFHIDCVIDNYHQLLEI